jgi:hypothetical protein
MNVYAWVGPMNWVTVVPEGGVKLAQLDGKSAAIPRSGVGVAGPVVQVASGMEGVHVAFSAVDGM